MRLFLWEETLSNSRNANERDESLSAYIRQVQKFPMLEADDEYESAKNWLEKGDKEARQKLVNSHLRLVVKIAAGYRGYGLPLADLIAEGNMGLLHATTKFDPEMGNRFSTYAQWWIRAAVQEYILKMWSTVKVGSSSSQKKLFFSLNRVKKQLGLSLKTTINDDDAKKIAKELNVDMKDVHDMHNRLSTGSFSLNSQVGGESEGAEWIDWLESEQDNQEEVMAKAQDSKHRKRIISEAMHVLNDREKNILVARRLDEPPKKLEELANVYKVSKERIRQIEMKAILKLQAFLEKYFKTNKTLKYLAES